MKRMSLGKTLRYQYEMHLKAVRDMMAIRNRYGEDRYVRNQGWAEGEAIGEARGEVRGEVRGRVKDVLELLGDLGEIPEELKKRIQSETDPQILVKWLKAAARADSISDFENKMAGK